MFGESTKAIQAVALTSVCWRRKRGTMWLERIPFKWQYRRRSTGHRTARVREWASACRGVPMVAHSALGIQHSARWPQTSLHLSLILFFARSQIWPPQRERHISRDRATITMVPIREPRWQGPHRVTPTYLDPTTFRPSVRASIAKVLGGKVPQV